MKLNTYKNSDPIKDTFVLYDLLLLLYIGKFYFYQFSIYKTHKHKKRKDHLRFESCLIIFAEF